MLRNQLLKENICYWVNVDGFTTYVRDLSTDFLLGKTTWKDLMNQSLLFFTNCLYVSIW